MSEHPFAQYVRILGKGPNLSRPLTFEETVEAAGMVLRGEVEPVQLGAFLCLLRVKTETPEEVAGFVAAARAQLDMPADAPRVDLDWSSYAGKSRQLPWYILAALLLAQNGVRVFMHGAEGHTDGRVYSRETLETLGIAPACSLAEAARQVATANFAFLPLRHLSPQLQSIIDLKPVLGLRSPVHTIARLLNPFRAAHEMQSVFHPAYRGVHQLAAQLLGQSHMAVFKGDGGEVERRPEKPCIVYSLHDGVLGEEEWPALLPDFVQPHQEVLDLPHLGAVWRGEADDAYGAATVIGTAAIALKLMKRAENFADAEALARHMWNSRRRDRLPGAA